jgi:C-terminal processing protease CtpA/Prc
MKKIILPLLLIVVNIASAQELTAKEAKKYYDQIEKIVQKNSIVIDGIDFDSLRTGFDNKIDSFKSFTKVGIYFIKALQKAGDKHSFYFPKSFQDKQNENQQKNLTIKSSYIENDIGYVNVPTCFTTDQALIKEYALHVRDAIVKLDREHNISNWIVDLRDNSGGTMWPMLEGLLPLLGEGNFGYFHIPRYNATMNWLQTSKNTSTGLANYECKNKNFKIAILIGARTGSSGEMTAISFMGKSNVKFFGQPSAGATTSNRTFVLKNGDMLLLASGYCMDRNKKTYTGKLIPDVVVEENNKDGKATIETAKNWLIEN